MRDAGRPAAEPRLRQPGDQPGARHAAPAHRAAAHGGHRRHHARAAGRRAGGADLKSKVIRLQLQEFYAIRHKIHDQTQEK